MENKVNILILISVLIMLPVTYAYVCQDQTDLSNLPCEIVTPITICSTNANVSDLGNLSKSSSVSMILKSGQIYNFTFPYTHESSYLITLCSNSTATITTGNLAVDYNDKWLWLYVSILVIAIGLFAFGFSKQDNILTLLSGFLFLAFGITFVSVGYPALINQTLKNSITLITLGIGMYITAMSSLELVKGE